MTIRYLLFTFFLLANTIAVLGAGVVSVNHYSSADGLSDNRVTTIIKDKEGFVWFGTWAGINRFDGTRFVTFKSNPGDFSSLKSNRIDEIVEDKISSFLWIRAYDNSIYRFDKKKHVFTPLTDLIKNDLFKRYQFSKILSVSNGKIWLKSTKGKIIVIDDAAGNSPAFDELNVLNDSSEKTYFFYLDERNYAWVSNERGLFLIRQNKQCKYAVEQYIIPFNNPIRIITSDKNGGVWASYENHRIIKLDTFFRKKVDKIITKGKIHDIHFRKNNQLLFCTTANGELISINDKGESKLEQSTADGEALYSIYEDQNNRIWLESEHYGVVRLDHNNQFKGLYPKKSYKFKPWVKNCSFFEDLNRNLWVSIRGYKLSVYDEKKDKLDEFGLNIEGLNRSFSRIILGVFYDQNGVLWITTDNGGLDRVTLQGNLFHQNYIQSNYISKAENEVRGLLEDRKGRLWIGTKSGKVVLNDNGKIFENPLGDNFQPKGGIYSIHQDKTGQFWVGTKGDGIFLIEEQNGSFFIKQHFLNTNNDKILHKSEVYSILEDNKGRIWGATFGAGLVLIEYKNGKYEVANDKLKNYPVDSYGKIRHLNTDAKGNIWIATSEGLILFNPDEDLLKGEFKVYKKVPGDIKSLGGNDIQFIYRDSQNQMWILTSSGGLNLAIGDNPLNSLSFKNYSKKQGLSSDFLLACAEDEKNNLWISTRNGISKFSLLNNKVQNYSYYDGLHETIFSEGSVAKLKSGEIVFGNILGYLYFKTNALNEKREKGNLVFTNFQINSENINLEDQKSPLKWDINYLSKLQLKHTQNIITLEFAMLESVSSNRHNFVYRLLGYDDVWRNTEGLGKVSYTNLPPGSYVFQVKSQNTNLFKGVSSRSIEIEVLPPFWKTWWAYSIYIVLFLIVLFFVKKTLATILALKQSIAVEKKLAEIKLNFFTQISHELRTPLTLIVNPIEEILETEKLSVKGKGYAKVILDNSKRMVRLINQVLDLRKMNSGQANLKIENTDLVFFIKNICILFDNYLSTNNIKVVLQSEFKELFIEIDIDKIETIIYNILANAIKFTPQESEILISLKVDEKLGVVTVSVTDEGPGVADNELDNIFQLYYEGLNSTSIKGTGIGLALSKELAELHGGKIFANNVEGKGLKVVLELPYQLKEQPILQTLEQTTIALQVVESKVILEQDIEEQKEQKTILIVEDNVDLRSFLNQKFENFYNIIIAENGQEGLEKAVSLLPDLILSDIMMPKMDGIQMLNKLKNNSHTSHIPVILLTAQHTVDFHIKSLKYGADYYLPKPLNMHLLFSAINNILLQRQKFFNNLVSKQKQQESNIEELKKNPIITELDQKFLEDTLKVVNEHLENPDFSIDAVADLIGMSRSSFFKKFKALTNVAPVDFLRSTRLEKAKSLFNNGHQNISTVAYMVGFNNPKYFSTCFKTQYGVTPKEYVKRCELSFSQIK